MRSNVPLGLTYITRSCVRECCWCFCTILWKRFLWYDWCTSSFLRRILIGSLVLLWRSFTNVRIGLRCVYIVFKSTLIVRMVGMCAALFATRTSALIFHGHGCSRGCTCNIASTVFVAWIAWSSVFRRCIITCFCPFISGRGLRSGLLVFGAMFAFIGLFFWLFKIQFKV